MLPDAGFAAYLACISAGIGARFLAILKLSPRRPGHALAQAVPLGLGAIVLATLGLGLIGRLDRYHLFGLIGISTIIGIVPGIRLMWESAGLSAHRAARVIARGSLLDRSLLGFTILALAGCCLAASVPVTDGDALCYHLQVPKVFLTSHAVSFQPDLHETVYPLVAELLDAIALEFRGPVACRWIQFLMGLVFAANVTLLAGPILKGRAWWAGAIAVLVPAISNGMSAPLNDMTLAAFGTAAIAATLRAIDRPSIRAAILAGCFLGLTLGVKYPALVLFGILAVVLSTSSGLAPTGAPGVALRRRFAMTIALITTTILVGGCWYLRAYMNTGNPVFPYFRHVFGGSGLDEVLDPTRRAMRVTPWNVLTALVPMTLFPDRFESFSHQLGPIFLLFLPAILFERAPRRVVVLVAIGYAFLMICVTQRQSMRFVLTALGPLAVGVAYLVRVWSLRRSIPTGLILGILIVALGMESAQALGRSRNGLKVVLGGETAEHYLSAREPTYRVGRWMEEHLPEHARLIGQDHRGYYLPRHYTMELAHRRRTGLGRRGETAREILDHLKRTGFTHLLLCPPIPETAVEFDPTLGRLLEPWLAVREPIFHENLADADGVIRRYSIYALDDVRERISVGRSEMPEVMR